MFQTLVARFLSFTLGGAGLLLAIIPVWSDVHGGAWVFAAFAASALFSALGLIPMATRRLRVRKFFGLSDRNPLLSLAVSTYQPREGYNPFADEKDFLFAKPYHGQEFPLRGVASSLGLSTAIQAAEAVSLLGKVCQARVVVSGDQGPSGDLHFPTGAVVCMGSPTSNFLSHEILQDIPEAHRPRFSSDELIWHGAHYRPTETQDYGVIARISTDEHIAILCAGVDEEGTIATMHHLLQNWHRMPKIWRMDISFVQICAVDKNRKEVTSVIATAQQVPTSITWAVEGAQNARSVSPGAT